MNNYLNESVCKECGGRCCKAMPGAMYPSDLEAVNKKSILKLLRTGNYAIDWWEGDPRYDEGIDEYNHGYFLRPRTKNTPSWFDGSWGGECIFLTGTGCKLKPDDRPHNCRMLEPGPNGKDCICHDESKQGAAIAWLPYHDIIEEIRSEHYER